jgi:microcompartment protein CcmK/EutM
MYLGRVIGCVWATAKDPNLDGQRMLLVQPLTPDLQNTGKRIVCTDCTGAGAGETVYWVRGKEASFPFLPAEPPTDATIVGIVDSLHLAPPVTALSGQVEPSRGLSAAPPRAAHGPALRKSSRKS